MADPTIFGYLIEDDQGLKNDTSIYEAYNGATTTVDSLIGSWLQAGALVDACVDGQIIGGQITIPLTPDASWKAAPAVGNNVNQLMILQMGNDFNRYSTEVKLPSYKEALLTPLRVPDLTDPALAALVTYLVEGDDDIFPNSRDLHDLDRLISAFLTVRKVRNQRTKTRVLG